MQAKKLSRRQVLRSGAALGTAAAFGFPAPTLAQGISGEIAFAVRTARPCTPRANLVGASASAS